jgi:hypothetical protein
MDITKEYILMCEKADKFLQPWLIVFSEYDNVTACSGHYQVITDSDQFIQHYFKDKEKQIWVILQDQLQEIVSQYIQKELGINCSEIKQAFIDFAHWLGTQYLPEKFTCVPTNCFDTGEKLWLAFTMEKVFQRKWTGTDWVTEK